jgi:hypothetical protein
MLSSLVPAHRARHGSVSFARSLPPSDPFDVASQTFGRLRFDALLTLVDLGAVGVFDEGEGGAIAIVGLDTEQGV